MALSFWQLLLVALLFLMLFGRGKITTLMTDLAGGIKSFKKGLQEDEPDLLDDVPHTARVAEKVASEQK